MNYDRSSTKEKWTFMKYIKNFDQIVSYAMKIRGMKSQIDSASLDEIQKEFENIGFYNPRFGKRNRTTLECKIRHIVYFMFGYTKKIGEDLKFVFSPLGNLLLDHYDNKEEVAKIFTAMLFSIEFHHPFNHMSKDFNLHPFRIIFKLLKDKRLGGILYNDEVFYYLAFIKKIDFYIYEQLVQDILKFRNMSCIEKMMLFKKDESVLADSLHLWKYTVGTLENAGVLINHATDGIKYGNLIQGKDTKRTYRLEYVSIHPQVDTLITKMLEKYPFNEKTIMSRTDLFRSDKVTELYNFYPEELIDELGIKDDKQERLLSILSITKKIEETSTNQAAGDCYTFEDVLTLAFNYFADVRAEKIGGAGNTDIECLYYKNNKKFDIEAKSTKNKLSSLNSGRLRSHRKRIGSEYTIVITPEYMPAVKYDRDIHYDFLNEIITHNLGTDISPIIDSFICDKLSNAVNSSFLQN